MAFPEGPGWETLGRGVITSICGPSLQKPSVARAVTCQKTVDASVWLGKRRPTTYEREREERLNKLKGTSCTCARKNDRGMSKSKLDLYTLRWLTCTDKLPPSGDGIRQKQTRLRNCITAQSHFRREKKSHRTYNHIHKHRHMHILLNKSIAQCVDVSGSRATQYFLTFFLNIPVFL